MAHDRGNLVVAQLELIDQAAIKDDLAARTTVGIELVTLDQIDLPLPLRRIRAEGRRLGDQAPGNRLDPPGIGAGLVQDPFATRLAQGLLVRLRIHLIDLLAR